MNTESIPSNKQFSYSLLSFIYAIIAAIVMLFVSN